MGGVEWSGVCCNLLQFVFERDLRCIGMLVELMLQIIYNVGLYFSCYVGFLCCFESSGMEFGVVFIMLGSVLRC